MAEQTPTQAAPAKQVPAFQAPKKKRKWLKRLIIVLVIVAAVVFAFLKLLSSGTQAIASNFLPAQAQTRNMTVTVTGPGTIQPNDSYRATALVRGEVLSAPFEEGQTVSKDDVLFIMDAADVENAVKQAQLAVQSAQLNYDSLVRTRNDNAKDRQVKANATGVVQEVFVDPGDTIAAGTPIAVILDRDNMKLAVPFHSADAASFFVGQSATVAVEGTSETLSGTVSELSATDSVGLGGTLIRTVTIVVRNPGALSPASVGTATVNGVTCAGSASFAYNASKQLVAKYSGELQTLTLKEGDRVSDGQLVGEFKETQMQDQIDAAAIQLENAQLSLRNAQDNLEDYTITSPIDGTVIEKNYKAGDNIDPTTASATGASAFLAVIYDMSRLTFDINVSERDVVKLAVGQKVTFTADALDAASFTGVVEKININGTTVNGNTSYPVTVAVDGDGMDLAGQGLLPGMSVSASIIIEEVGNVLCIPVDAVSRTGSGTVMVALPGALDESGILTDLSKTETRQVTLGRNDDEYIEVLSGLEEGETVLIQNTSSNFMQTMMGM